MRILLATDDSNLRLAVYLLLSEEPGMDIVGTASDVMSMLALHATSCPDLVLVDYMLGGMRIDGPLTKLKSCQEPAQIIVMGLNSTERDLALQAGADRFVLKGGPPQELLDNIRNA